MFVAQLWRHPVKSLGGERLDRAAVTSRGVEGDRVHAVRDVATGDPLSAKRVPRLLEASAVWQDGRAVVTLHGTRYEAGDPRLDRALSDWLERDVHLATNDDDRFFDSRPLHLVTTASLRLAAIRHPAGDWDPRRFRMNVLVDGDEIEDGWTSASLGRVRIDVAKRTVRCAMVTVEQPGLAEDQETLRSLPDKYLGVYATVSAPGTIVLGDPVTAR